LRQEQSLILCSFRNLSLSFGTKSLFSSAELIVEQGDKIGLLGLNGKGKSSLFKILEGQLSSDTTVPPFIFDKHQSFTLFHVPQEIPETIPKKTPIKDCFWYFYPDLRSLFEKLNEVNQKIESGDDDSKLLDQQTKVLDEIEAAGGWGLQQSFESYCGTFGLPDLNENLENLSGGGRKKVLLSLGLSTDKQLVLWDEPTNHLDIETIRELEEELLTTNKTFIMVSHDRYLLGKTTNKIFQISNEKIESFTGGYQDFLTLQAQREKERELMLSRLKNSFRREDAWMKQGIKARGTRSKKRVEGFEDIKSKIQNLKSQAKRDLSLSISSGQKKSKILMEASDVSFSYGQTSILSELNFSIAKGNKIGLLGPNGAGKTTLINLINKALKPTKGNVRHAPELVVKTFTQLREELPLDKSPYDILGDGTDQVSLPNGGSQHVLSYFKKFLFNGDEVRRPLSTFSGGERNRLQIALNLKEAADIWIFDEPTNDLDLETLNILENVLQDFEGSIIVISHDRLFLKNITNRLFVLDSGRLEVFEGGYDQAEAYLEVKALEESLRDQLKPDEPVQSTSTTPDKSSELTGDEGNQIAELEEFIAKIDKVMQDLGSLQHQPESVEKLVKLSKKKEEKEEELLSLYEKIDSN
jgi:ATP-binding cassette subfamily F protein uup